MAAAGVGAPAGRGDPAREPYLATGVGGCRPPWRRRGGRGTWARGRYGGGRPWAAAAAGRRTAALWRRLRLQWAAPSGEDRVGAFICQVYQKNIAKGRLQRRCFGRNVQPCTAHAPTGPTSGAAARIAAGGCERAAAERAQQMPSRQSFSRGAVRQLWNCFKKKVRSGRGIASAESLVKITRKLQKYLTKKNFKMLKKKNLLKNSIKKIFFRK